MNPDCHCEQALLAVPGIAELLDGLAVYTQNHFARLGRLQRSAYLLDYTLASMSVLLTPAAGDEDDDLGGAKGFEMHEVIGAEDRFAACGAVAAIDAPPSPSTPPQQEGGAEPAAGDSLERAVAAGVAGTPAGGGGAAANTGAVADGQGPPDEGRALAATLAAQVAEHQQQQPSGGRKQSSAKKSEKKKRKSAAPLAAVNDAPGGAPSATPTARKGKRAKA